MTEPTLATVARRVGDLVAEPAVVAVFTQCLTRTLHRAVRRLDDGTVFVVTGDIPAMWLRDSSAAMWPYLRLCGDDAALQDLIVGVLARQFRYVVTDPYANAFNATPDGAGHRFDRPGRDPWVWERKYEVDSLCYPLDLAYRFWRATGRADHFDGWYRRAARLIVTTWTTEQDHETRSRYTFRRPLAGVRPTLERHGRGPRVAVTGMTWSGFRPSDDACRYGYHIPQNMFAAVVLGQLAQVAADVLDDADLGRRALALRDEIEAGIVAYGIVDHPQHGRIYAYEVDGFGGVNLMDDANVPSLLAAPLLGFAPAGSDAIHRATRRFVLSEANPYFWAGRDAAGIGSPHTPKRHVWPIALAVAALTSPDRGEQREVIGMLVRTGVGGAMHESFHSDRPDRYTREWFCWADAMFCELVLAYCGVGPEPAEGLISPPRQASPADTLDGRPSPASQE
jgi:meiotically up-regulated gene 157 (Mug157) protein